MASIGEKAISILAGNLNSGRSYLITAVKGDFWFRFVNTKKGKGIESEKKILSNPAKWLCTQLNCNFVAPINVDAASSLEGLVHSC